MSQLPQPTHTRTCRLLVRDRSQSINMRTLLATDYLNHFNEVVMILDMLLTMPDCLEEATAWQPKSYSDHFMDSGFPEKALAVLAYEQAPLDRREPFDALVAEINETVRVGVEEVSQALADGDDDRTFITLKGLTAELQEMIGRAGGIINGDERASAGQVSDSSAPQDQTAEDDTAATMSQASIDSLFD